MNLYYQAVISDLKIIFRDPSLRFFLALPILIFAVLNGFLPYLVNTYPAVSDYVPYVIISATTETTQMFGFIYAMILIEEKETNVAKEYGVLPISQEVFTLLRLSFATIFTGLMTWLILLLQPFYEVSVLPALLYALTTAIIVPVYILSIALLSKNKMEGIVWIKVVNLIILVPILAFFVPEGFAFLFGIIPTHWFFQSLSGLLQGSSPDANMIIGTVYLLVVLAILTRMHAKKHFS